MSAVNDDDRHWRRKGSTSELLPPLEPVRSGFYGSRILGGLAEVTTGCMVWAHADGDLNQVRVDDRGEPRGGIVLNTFPADTIEADGEIVTRQHYRCWNPWRPPGKEITVLTETQIVRDGCEAPSPTLLAKAIRRIDRYLSDRHGPITADQAQLQADAAHLAAVLMGART